MNSELVDYIQDELSAIYGTTIFVKRLFGVYGLFLYDKMIAFIYNEELYIKENQHNKDLIERNNCQIFTYYKKGQLTCLYYYKIDISIIDDREELKSWFGMN